MPNYVDSKVLLWNPDLLWAGYLKIHADWESDKIPNKPDVETFDSPRELAYAMQIFMKEPRYEHSKLRWQILFTFGYAALKLHYRWEEEKMEQHLATRASGSEELGGAAIETGFLSEFGEVHDDEGPGFMFDGSIPPD